MDDKVKALEYAALHAWVTIGDHLSKQPISREEWQNMYDALGAALEALKEKP
jgi:hypothetical protein